MSKELFGKLQALRIERRPSEHSSRLPMAALVLAIAAAFALVAYAWSSLVVPALSPKVRVGVVAAVLGVDAGPGVRLVATGYVAAEEVWNISPLVSGVVESVAVTEGAMVKQGDPIYALDRRLVSARVMGTRAQVTAATADMVRSQAELMQAVTIASRNRQMSEQNLLPRNQALDAQATVTQLARQFDATEARAQAATAALRALELELELTRVRAPISGLVLGPLPLRGEFVTPGYETARPRVANLASLRVVVELPEARMSMLEQGAPCQVFLEAIPTLTLTGHLVTLGAEVNRAKGTLLAWVALDPLRTRAQSSSGAQRSTPMLPGMSARVHFLSSDPSAGQPKQGSESCCKVPAGAVVRKHGVAGVYVVEAGRVEWREVVVDRETTSEMILHSGVRLGERVALPPHDNLKTGQRVKEAEE